MTEDEVMEELIRYARANARVQLLRELALFAQAGILPDAEGLRAMADAEELSASVLG